MKGFRLVAFLFSVLLWTGCCDEKADEPTVTIHSNNITEGALMDLNRGCVFYYEATQTLRQATWTLEIPTESGEIVTIATAEATAETPDFTIAFPASIPTNIYSIIPDREDFLRTEASGMLDARVHLTGSFANGAPANAEFKVKLPYRPAKPTLEIASIEDDINEWISNVTIRFNSLGASHYVIARQEVEGNYILYYSAEKGETTKILPYIFMDVTQQIDIYAENEYGKSKKTTIYIGGNIDYYIQPNNQ